MRALISWAVYFLPSISTLQLVPMWSLTERIVRSGLVMAWRLATSPTSTSPALEKPTTEGVVRAPSALGMTVGSPASSTETTELVVPRSMPTALGMGSSSRGLILWFDYRNLSPPLSRLEDLALFPLPPPSGPGHAAPETGPPRAAEAG